MMIIAKFVAAFAALFLLMIASGARHQGAANMGNFAEDWNGGFMFISHVVIGISCVAMAACAIHLGWTGFRKRRAGIGHGTK